MAAQPAPSGDVPDSRATVPAALAALCSGRPVVVLDHQDRENEGDLIIAAEFATPESIAFMTRHTSGLLCVAIDEPAAHRLELPQMVQHNTDAHATAFTVSVDARSGVTTGISAHDRARTIRLLADPMARPHDLTRPGHVFPLRARPGGVLARPGHTEAGVDLMRLAGLSPVAALSELQGDDGQMLQGPALDHFARRFGLVSITVDDIIAYRCRTETLVQFEASAPLPTPHATFTAHVYRSTLTGHQHLALTLGELWDRPPLTRVHSECLTGDVFGSTRCDCRDQLTQAREAIAAEGRGILIYLRGHEGRGIGLADKLRAYRLQDVGHDTVDANLELDRPVDARSYIDAGHILRHLRVSAVRLLTNNPRKRTDLTRQGIDVTERVPAVVPDSPHNRPYLVTKRQRLGHLFTVPGCA